MSNRYIETSWTDNKAPETNKANLNKLEQSTHAAVGYDSASEVKALGTPTSVFSVNVTPSSTLLWYAGSTASDDGVNTLIPTGHTGAGRWIRKVNGVVELSAFVDTDLPDTYDYTSAINTASAYAQTVGLKLNIPRREYLISDQISFVGVNVCFNNSSFKYDGPDRQWAITLDSLAPNTRTGNTFTSFSLSTTPNASDIVTASTTFDPPSIAAYTGIGNPATAVSTVVSCAGAVVGGMVTATFSIEHEFIDLTARVLVDGQVTVYFNSGFYGPIDLASGTLTVSVLNNPRHGICFGGTLGRTELIKVAGFTGVSAGFGDGVDPASGIQMVCGSKVYYWDIDLNIAASLGYGLVIPISNNENYVGLSTFPYNGFQDSVPRRANFITQLAIGGLSNKIKNLSLEGSCSGPTIRLAYSANGNKLLGNGYIEGNSSWVTSPFPRVLANSGSSANEFKFRHPYDGLLVKGNGTSNRIEAEAAFSLNGKQQLLGASSANLIRNGTFTYGMANWSNYSTNSTSAITSGGFIRGNKLRIDSTAGRPILEQDLGVNLAGLIGSDITLSAVVKTNIASLRIRINNETNSAITADEVPRTISTTYRVKETDTGLLAYIIGPSNDTGYVEVSDVSVVVSNAPAVMLDDGQTLGGTFTFDPPDLPAAGGTETTTVTVVGAELGDLVIASLRNNISGAMMSAHVSAADTVTIVLFNPSPAIVYIGNGPLNVKVFKA